MFVDFDTAQFEESAAAAVADCLLVRYLRLGTATEDDDGPF